MQPDLFLADVPSLVYPWGDSLFSGVRVPRPEAPGPAAVRVERPTRRAGVDHGARPPLGGETGKHKPRARAHET